MSRTGTAASGSEITEDINFAKEQPELPDLPEQSSALRTAYVVYLIVFYAVWAVYELLLKPRINGSGIPPVPAKLLTDGVIKNLVWTLPAVLLAKRFAPQNVSEVHPRNRPPA